jgi:hypothetical protein
MTPSGFSTPVAYNIVSGSVSGKIDLTNGRFTAGTVTNHSVAFITNNTERVFLGSDGHWKMNGGQIHDLSALGNSAGRTVSLWDGDNGIRFAWSGGDLQVWVDNTFVGSAQLA